LPQSAVGDDRHGKERRRMSDLFSADETTIWLLIVYKTYIPRSERVKKMN